MKKVLSLPFRFSLPMLVSLLMLAACGNDSTSPPDNGDNNGPDTTGTDSGMVSEVGLELVAENLTAPVAMAAPNDGSGRLFVADQSGMIRIITADGQLLEEPFLDLQDRMIPLNSGYDERGLLALAFHPDFDSNGRFYVYYSAPLRAGAPEEWDHTSHLSEFTVSADSNRAAPASERILMQIDQPQSNHNGSTLAFGPDDYLYISLGDGGNANDDGPGHVPDWYEENAGGNGQDITDNLLGSILRIDVDSGTPYGIPGDNPFVDSEARDEIYAYGLRNPFRFSFDREGDQALIAGDVGQVRWEEINVIESGGNYGWNVKEGTECFNAASNNQPLEECPDSDTLGNTLVNPVITMETGVSEQGGEGRAIIGGYVYRGEAIPGLQGQYVYGMWTTSNQPSGAVYNATRSGEGPWDFQELQLQQNDSSELGEYLLAMGQDRQGELYLLTSSNPGPTGETGRVYRMVPANSSQ